MTITLEEVVAAVDAAVVRFGADHKNPVDEATAGCVYTDEYGRHCIAGQVLVDLGLHCPEYGDNDNAESFLEIERGSRWDARAETFLAEVQSLADDGATWGAAVAGIKKVRRLG